MDNITFHKDRLSEFEAAVEEQKGALRRNPNDQSAKFFATAYESYIKDTKHDLSIAQAERLQELFELRLLGTEVSNGSIRLDTLANLAAPLSSAFKHAAHRLHFGKVAHKVDRAISEMLDLRLGALGLGSTKLFITGNISPDLTGQSLLQQTLDQVFKLLTSRDDEFYDAVDAVGIKAARRFDELLRTLQAHSMAAEWNWKAPAKEYRWSGSSDEIIRVRTMLGTISEPESFVEHIEGEVSAISERGRIEVRTREAKLKIRFALEQTPTIEEIHLHQTVRLKIETNRYFDSLSKKHVSKHFLISKE
jgi:hypothetical protein